MLGEYSTETLAVILATSDGSDLKPLADRRACAAMPFGGSYRIIDFALTNCLHSGVRRTMVLTQYHSLSLQNHLRDGWSIFNTELGEFITPVTPPISPDETSVYTSPGSALFRNLYLFQGVTEQNILVISGEQIYRMDYAAMLRFHIDKGADVTIAAVDREDINGAEFDAELRCEIDKVVAINRFNRENLDEKSRLPMGVYAFSRDYLIEILQRAGADGVKAVDIDGLVMNHQAPDDTISVYEFGGSVGRVSQDRYWRQLDSLDHYYQANMDLLELDPRLDLYQVSWPIRTHQTQRPPARTVPGRSDNEGICVNSIVSGGTVIAGGGVNHSVLGNRVYIDDGATVEESILFSDVRVGEGAQLRRCICDRGVVIPAGEQIGFDAAIDRKRFHVTDEGVVVIPVDHVFEAPES
ncbi:MAG: sugar phosphate nucleotidyltransferase [Pseudomonadota bacterium]